MLQAQLSIESPVPVTLYLVRWLRVKPLGERLYARARASARATGGSNSQDGLPPSRADPLGAGWITPTPVSRAWALETWLTTDRRARHRHQCAADCSSGGAGGPLAALSGGAPMASGEVGNVGAVSLEVLAAMLCKATAEDFDRLGARIGSTTVSIVGSLRRT